MKWKHIWELTKINLLYSNNQALTNIRKKQAKSNNKIPKPAYRGILIQQLLGIVVYSFLFSYLFTGIPYAHYKGYFSFQIFLFLIMSIASGFSTMFSVFYNSSDSKLYLSLPVTETEVYLAKLLSSLGLNLTFLMPTFSLFLIVYCNIFDNFFLAIPVAILQFILLACFSIATSLVLAHFLGRLLLKVRQRNTIATTLMMLSSFGAIGLIFFLQYLQGSQIESAQKLVDVPAIPIIVGFYHIAYQPFSIESIHYLVLLLIIAALIIFVFKKAIPTYYQQITDTEKKKTAHSKQKTPSRSLRKTLIFHHSSTLKDPTLLSAALTAPIFFGFFFIPMIGKHHFDHLTVDYFGIILFVGIVLGYLTGGTFTAVGMSVEKENFFFLKSLPIDFKGFLRQKFYLFWVLQTVLPFLVFSILTLLVGLSLPHIFSLLIGLVVGSYPCALSTYKRDYKLFTPHWQHINQLFMRGRGQLMNTIILFGSLFLSGGIVVALFFLSQLIGAWIVSYSVTFFFLCLLIFLHIYYEKTLWSKLNLP